MPSRVALLAEGKEDRHPCRRKDGAEQYGVYSDERDRRSEKMASVRLRGAGCQYLERLREPLRERLVYAVNGERRGARGDGRLRAFREHRCEHKEPAYVYYGPYAVRYA